MVEGIDFVRGEGHIQLELVLLRFLKIITFLIDL
jgi:hypothetical protein